MILTSRAPRARSWVGAAAWAAPVLHRAALAQVAVREAAGLQAREPRAERLVRVDSEDRARRAAPLDSAGAADLARRAVPPARVALGDREPRAERLGSGA